MGATSNNQTLVKWDSFGDVYTISSIAAGTQIANAALNATWPVGTTRTLHAIQTLTHIRLDVNGVPILYATLDAQPAAGKPGLQMHGHTGAAADFTVHNFSAMKP